jgi:hypothetical protein
MLAESGDFSNGPSADSISPRITPPSEQLMNARDI